MAAENPRFKLVVQKPADGVSSALAESTYARKREALDPIAASVTLPMAAETRRHLGREIATEFLGNWPPSAVDPGVRPCPNLIRRQSYPVGRGPSR